MKLLRNLLCLDIVRDHFRSASTLFEGTPVVKRLATGATFVGAPLLVGVVFLLLDFHLHDSAALLTVVSVLGGFLFALLVMMLQLAADAAATTPSPVSQGKNAHYRRLAVLKLISANVSYSVLLCVVSAGILSLAEVRVPYNTSSWPDIRTFVGVTILVHLTLTLLLIVRRTYSLLTGELIAAGVTD